MKKHHALPAVIVTGGSILVGCGHHNGTYYSYAGSSCGSYGSCYAAPAYGRYAGTLSGAAGGQSTRVTAIIDRNGQGRMSGTDGTYYRLSMNGTGAALRGSLSGFARGKQFPNGSAMTSDVIVGRTDARTLTATVTDQSGDSQQLSLTRTADETAPSLAALSGTWTSELSGTNMTLSIAADGSLRGSDSKHCTYSGTFGVIGTRFDLYRESFDRICDGASTPFSGLSSHQEQALSSDPPHPPEITMLADDDDGHFLSITLAKQ